MDIQIGRGTALERDSDDRLAAYCLGSDGDERGFMQVPSFIASDMAPPRAGLASAILRDHAAIDALLAAALNIVVLEGVSGLTLRPLAKQLGVSPSSVKGRRDPHAWGARDSLDHVAKAQPRFTRIARKLPKLAGALHEAETDVQAYMTFEMLRERYALLGSASERRRRGVGATPKPGPGPGQACEFRPRPSPRGPDLLLDLL